MITGWAMGIQFCSMLFKLQWFSFRKMHLKLSFAKCRPFCSGLIVLVYRKWRRRWQRFIMVTLCWPSSRSSAHHSWDLCHKGFRSSRPRSCENICVAFTRLIMVISGQNYAHATTAELSWHVHISDQSFRNRAKVYSQDFNDEWINCLWNSSFMS